MASMRSKNIKPLNQLVIGHHQIPINENHFLCDHIDYGIQYHILEPNIHHSVSKVIRRKQKQQRNSQRKQYYMATSKGDVYQYNKQQQHHYKSSFCEPSLPIIPDSISVNDVMNELSYVHPLYHIKQAPNIRQSSSLSSIILSYITTLSSLVKTSFIISVANTSIKADVDDKGISRFDSDSFAICIGNCCSRTISFQKEDFIQGTLYNLPIKSVITGFGNTETPIQQAGTIKWSIIDDSGQQHYIIIPNSYFVPSSGIRLLSPQHWAQESHEVHNQGIVCTTYGNKMELRWHNQDYIKTIPIIKSACNTGILWSKPAFKRYAAFTSVFEERNIDNLPPEVDITSTEDSQGGKSQPESHPDDENDEESPPESHPDNEPGDENDDFEHYKCSIDDSDAGDYAIRSKMISSERELMSYHERMAHMPFAYLQNLAAKGIIPKQLAKCCIPTCPSCLYGKMSQKQWRTKASPRPIASPKEPGAFVSVDQLEAGTPGLIAQLKGIPTRDRYLYATIFVDHKSDFTFIFLQKYTTPVETLRAKVEFERVARSYGVNIAHYHSDNGRFIDNAWWNDALQKGQRMTMCGVNAHHQNGKVERRIRQLQELARASLLQSSKLWPGAINISLWPYAIRKAVDDINTIMHPGNTNSPLEKLASVVIRPSMKDKHTFGCPMYILDNRLQSKKRIPKWEARSRLAIYIGPSPNHATSIGLGLSITTGMVTPAFHAYYDDSFETVNPHNNLYIPSSKWQVKCGFQKEGGMIRLENILNTNKDQPPSNEDNDIPILIFDDNVINDDNVGTSDNQNSTIETSEPNYNAVPQQQTKSPQRNQIDHHTNQLRSNNQTIPTTTRSGRTTRKPDRYGDSVAYQVSSQQSNINIRNSN